jgi:hypothetical protein
MISILNEKQNRINKSTVILCLFLNTLLIVVSEQEEAFANLDLFPSNFTRNSL